MVDSKYSVLILFAHPAFHKSQVNKTMLQHVLALNGVTVHDLYESYPDFYIDVEAEQALLKQSDLIIFHHPMQWYSSPAILKEWQDVVLRLGFAYGTGGNALEGKDFMLAISTRGSAESYRNKGSNRFTIEEFLRPFEQTALLCGLKYHPPFVLQDCYSLSKQEITSHAEKYSQLLEEYVNNKNLLVTS